MMGHLNCSGVNFLGELGNRKTQYSLVTTMCALEVLAWTKPDIKKKKWKKAHLALELTCLELWYIL